MVSKFNLKHMHTPVIWSALSCLLHQLHMSLLRRWITQFRSLWDLLISTDMVPSGNTISWASLSSSLLSHSYSGALWSSSSPLLSQAQFGQVLMLERKESFRKAEEALHSMNSNLLRFLSWDFSLDLCQSLEPAHSAKLEINSFPTWMSTPIMVTQRLMTRTLVIRRQSVPLLHRMHYCTISWLMLLRKFFSMR